MAAADIAIWCLVIVLLLVGLAGSVLPLLPGTTLILGGVLLQKWLLPDTLSWTAVAWIGVFWLASIISDMACTLVGTRLFGGGKWGMAGASGGALVGMFFSLPILLFGTMLGAVLAEKWGAKRTDAQAFKSGLGAALGFLASTVVRLACALAMLAIYGISVFTAAPTAAP
ncbi:MAG TPA: DUF456 domain-containing protein [Opitutaceae bacterium]|nr:DUF456 domain-containing protein [Opitutaceae bacterium]